MPNPAQPDVDALLRRIQADLSELDRIRRSSATASKELEDAIKKMRSDQPDQDAYAPYPFIPPLARSSR